MSSKRSVQRVFRILRTEPPPGVSKNAFHDTLTEIAYRYNPRYRLSYVTMEELTRDGRGFSERTIRQHIQHLIQARVVRLIDRTGRPLSWATDFTFEVPMLEPPIRSTKKDNVRLFKI